MADNREVTHMSVDKAQEGKDYSVWTVKVSIDADDAVKTLKAIQREAREATKALRELESYYSTENGRYFTDKVNDAHTDELANRSDGITVRSLQIEELKDSLKEGNKPAKDAVALIEEQEKMIAELESRLTD